MTFANVVLYIVYPNVLGIEMIKMLRVSSEVLAVCDTGNYCFWNGDNKELLGNSLLEIDW